MSRASDCNLMKLPKQNTLVVRVKTPIEKMPEHIGKSYEAIFKYMAEIGEYPCAVPFVIYHNMDFQNMDVEIGVVVSKKYEGKGDIKPGVIEESLVAQTMHLGTYRELEPTYDDLSKFVEDNKLKATGKAIEWYHNDWNHVSEEKLITTIMLLLS